MIWLFISPKCTYFFQAYIRLESRVKYVWASVVEGWVIYQEVIRDIVQVKSKHGERSRGDCRFSKHDYRASEKLTHHPSQRMESTDRVNGCGWLINRGRSERYRQIMDSIYRLYYYNFTYYILELFILFVCRNQINN